MENLPYRRQQYSAAGGGEDSARLLQSKSGRTAAVAPVHPESENFRIKSMKKAPKKQEATDGGGFVTFLPRSRSQTEKPRRTRSRTTSPSAWALSPGRSMPWSSPAPALQPPARFEKSTKQETKGCSEGSRGVSGVLKYFRQKKVSPLLEEEYHRYRVTYNRLLQWRFANARADVCMAAVRKAAQLKLWNGWIKISMMRNSTLLDERMRIQNMKHELKVFRILQLELKLLEEWSRIEKRNAEAVGRVVRKLSAISVCLPLVQNAEGDMTSVDGAISTATEVMDGIAATIQNMHLEVERGCFLLTELSVVLNQQKHLFRELETDVTHATSFAVQEKILRAQQIQLVNEVNIIEA